MASPVGYTKGCNDHWELDAASFGEPLLILLSKLVRGLREEQICEHVNSVLEQARKQGDAQITKSLFVLAFQTRWCRGGKGERKLFLILMRNLYKKFPTAVLELLSLVPSFGYWKDLLLLLQECKTADIEQQEYDLIADKVWTLYADQLRSDYEELLAAQEQERDPHLSLCGKFAPSEGHLFARELGAIRGICQKLYGDVLMSTNNPDKASRYVKGKYRRMLSQLRRALHICEVKMSGNEWETLDFKTVPSLAVSRYMKAFLNEPVHGQGLRSNDQNRMMCREAFLEATHDKALNGKQLFPHEIVQKVLRQKQPSEAFKQVYETLWEKVRENVEEMISNRKKELATQAEDLENHLAVKAKIENVQQESELLSVVQDVLEAKAVESNSVRPVDLGKTVAMSDVSGSMTGTPMLVSIALGILCSEVSHPAYRDRVLTFSNSPSWHNLKGCTNIVDKVHSLSQADWGSNTDLYKAMQLVLELVRREGLQADEIPNLLIISDMQFDQASGQEPKTAYENMKELFRQGGMSLYGRPIDPPHIIFWNVNSSSNGFPTQPDTPGVTLLSGFSPSLLKFVLSGELEKETVGEKQKSTPNQMLLNILNEPGLEPVRSALDKMDNAMFL